MQTSSLPIITFIYISISLFLVFQIFSSLFLSETQTLVAKVKDNQGSLDGNITENADANAIVALETTKASVAIDGSKVDQATGDGDGRASNSEGE